MQQLLRRRGSRTPTLESLACAGLCLVIALSVGCAAGHYVARNGVRLASLAEVAKRIEPGDVITLGRGRFCGPLPLKSDVTVSGSGAFATTVYLPGGGPVASGSGVAGVTLRDLRLVGSSVSASPVVWLVDSEVRLVRVAVENEKGAAVAVSGSATRAIVSGCYLAASRGPGIVASNGAYLDVRRSVFYSGGVKIVGSTARLWRNRIFDCKGPALLFDGSMGSVAASNLIIDAETGVICRTGSSVTLSGNRIVDARRGLVISSGSQVWIRGAAILDSGAEAITVEDAAVSVADCWIERPGLSGIVVGRGGLAEVASCVIRRAGDCGVRALATGASVTVASSRILRCHGPGLSLENASVGDLKYTVIAANRGPGVDVQSGASCFIFRNTIATNRGCGLKVAAGARASISYCIVAFNRGGIVSQEGRGLFCGSTNCLWRNGANYIGWKGLSTDFSADPLFASRHRLDFRLKEGSPCIIHDEETKIVGACGSK